nr:MAG TPA: hypothetical protein [Caudoviricetes sp.]
MIFKLSIGLAKNNDVLLNKLCYTIVYHGDFIALTG